MKDTQVQMLRIAKVLEGMGYHITEHYNSANFLKIYVDYEPKTLGQMIDLWRKGR